MTSCPNCQAPIGDRARFCGSCGAEVVLTPAGFAVEQAAPGVVLKERYKLVRSLPARGSARREGSLLWEAQDSTTGGRVQLQLFPKAVTDNPAHVTELKRLCELWQKADHPAVVRLERLELDPTPYLVLEHVDAISFEELLASRSGREQGPFTAEELSTLLPPVGEALDKLAERGLMHGAVEPGHLLVPDARFGPAARVTLPGVGALIRDALGNTEGGAPGYTAPEQQNGRVERRTDVYALGVTIAHLLTGKHPLAGGAADLTAIPAPMRGPLERALSTTVEQRPAAAGMLVRDLVDAARKVKDAPPPASDGALRVTKSDSGLSIKLANLDGPARVGAPDARAALRATPPPPAPAPVEEVEKTVRFVPGMIDAAMAGSAPTPPAPPPPPAAPPPPVQKAAPPPPPPAPVQDFEKTIRFVPGMTDESQAAAKVAAPPPPPRVEREPVKAQDPRPKTMPPTPPPVPEMERTIRFVPGMTDNSLAAPAPQVGHPPTPQPTQAPAQPRPNSNPGSSAQPAAAPHAGAKGDKPAEQEGGAAILEWVLIIALGLIALWQIAKTLS